MQGKSPFVQIHIPSDLIGVAAAWLTTQKIYFIVIPPPPPDFQISIRDTNSFTLDDLKKFMKEYKEGKVGCPLHKPNLDEMRKIKSNENI